LSRDAATRTIVLYIEGLRESQRFMKAARAAACVKPVLALKVGRHAEGARAARSHTGALAGSDSVYDAAFRRGGMLRVDSMPELFDAIETLALTAPASGERLAIVTNGGGPGVIATDALIAGRGRLAELSAKTVENLNSFLSRTWSRSNPIDMIGDAPPQDYDKVLDALFADDAVDGILVLHAPTALADPRDAARAVIENVQARAGDPTLPNVFTAWLGEHLVAPARELFEAARIPTYETPEDAVAGFMHRARYQQNQALLAAEPILTNGVTVDGNAVREIIDTAVAAQQSWLEADAVAGILTAYGIPMLQSRIVSDVDGAVLAASVIGGPVALKICSPQITHKSDVGGVVLDLEGADRIRAEARAMIARVKNLKPGAQIEGFLVQEMARRPGAFELIVGLSVDPVFGPIVLFGQGGTAVELIADTSLELPPLPPAIARAQMARTRVWRLLQGYRDMLPADIDAIANVLTRIGQLAIDQPAIGELDINPLLADHRGVIALDARIMIRLPRRQALAATPT
ncbi:MAG: acetate--CoA ligase family protein, partial [Candidatus Eremiobacteraeota bacterium]|nr:acetate--CoA ligase family protein [Candidatus Eremiobacteraeota bacterium]